MAAAGVAMAAWCTIGGSRAFTQLHPGLGLAQRDVRLFNNFTSPQANASTSPDPNWPGFTGAALAIWKGAPEWGSSLHGDGSGDPTQADGVGSGGANFDASWQGLATGPGSLTDNVISAAVLAPGVITLIENVGPNGWRIRFNDDLAWSDDPAGNTVGAFDIQGLCTRAYGFALGLGNSTVTGSTSALRFSLCP
jgi:hypothetical protein